LTWKESDMERGDREQTTSARAGGNYSLRGMDALAVSRDSELIRRAARGDRRAREQMVRSHMALVNSIARRFMGTRLEFEDLVQEGMLGLITAMERFEPERGHQFSTYATYWVRQAICRAIDNQARLIRIPVNVAYAALQVKRVTHELTQRLGREPTEEEISREADLPARKVRHLRATPDDALSLDAAAPTEDGEEIGGLQVEDHGAPNPEREAMLSAERQALFGLLDHLSERERRVLRDRMGFEDGEPRTLREIADQLHVSREAVRRIEASALRRLRSVAPQWLAA
jgi:RNA polymerase primary sigma factor